MGKRLFSEDACIVDEKLCLKPVGAVQNKVVFRKDGEDIIRGQKGGMQDDPNIRIARGDGASGGLEFGPSDALRGVDDLTVQIGQLNRVAVRNADRADTRTGEVQQGGGAECAGADDQNTGVTQSLLSARTEFRQQKLAGVAIELIAGKIHHDGFSLLTLPMSVTI